MVTKRASYGSALFYLNGRQATLMRYLQKFYPPYDWGIIKHFFMDNPVQAKVILSDFSKSNDAKLFEVAKMFIEGKSKIVFVVGARGSGKTATTFMFAEVVNREVNRPIFYVSEDVNSKLLPKWMKCVKEVSDIPKGSFAIIDESAIQYSSRDALKDKNKLLGKELSIARHREIFLIFITQHIAMSDINLDRLKDLVIWKKSNDYTFGTRDKKSQEGKFWNKVRTMMSPRSKSECLFEYPAYKRFIHFSHLLPECWSDELSKTWKDVQLNKKKEEDIIKQREDVKILKL
tara:strand:- start:1919 stop:2785 length:867 start_codon:yes stop_codon:yes gene_type:complete